MVGRAGRCGGGWSVGSGLREQKGDQVGERQRGPGEGARVVQQRGRVVEGAAATGEQGRG